MCAFIFFRQALFVHRKPIFSSRQVTRNAKKIGWGTEPTSANLQTSAYTTGPPPETIIIWLRDHLQTERQKNFFSKIARYFGFPHDCNNRATKRKVCLGPGTEIQGTGSLFWRKIGPPICLPICWDFFADLGAGL